MRFSLKDIRADIQFRDWTYRPSCHSGRMAPCLDVRSICDRETLFSLTVLELLFPYSKVALIEIELIIGLFSVFEVMEPQGNYVEEFYGPGEYKLTWMFCCYISCIARILYLSSIHIL
jgi:hypothetical protein